MSNQKKSFLPLFLFLLFLPIFLSGCFKADVSLEVRENGSGLIGLAFGVDDQSKAFLSDEGFDFMELVSQAMNQNLDENEVKMFTWDDGQYEWSQITREFSSMNHINEELGATKIFKAFSLQKKLGLFQNTFILEAELAPLNESLPGSEDAIFNIGSIMEATFSVKLPGEIETTNGAFTHQNAEEVVWNLRGDQPIMIHARSVTRNWVGISTVIALGALILLGIGVLFIGVIWMLLVNNKQNNKIEPE